MWKFPQQRAGNHLVYPMPPTSRARVANSMLRARLVLLPLDQFDKHAHNSNITLTINFD
jgi:hypothetical protein